MENKSVNQQPIMLYTEQTPNPESLKFVTNRMNFKGTADFKTEELAKEWKMDANEKRYFWKDLDLTVSYQRLIKDYVEELWDDKSSVESFIQLIGNKMYIYNKANIIKSNKCWNDQGGNKGAKSILTEHFDANPNTSFEEIKAN